MQSPTTRAREAMNAQIAHGVQEQQKREKEERKGGVSVVKRSVSQNSRFQLAQSMADEASAARKRLRVLCLHGFRTSGGILEQQLGRWDPSLHRLLDMTFLDAPFPCRGKSDVEGIFSPPYYEWFSYDITFKEYEGLEECIEYISDYMYKHGPFDGLIGFSQGAVLSAALAGLQQKSLYLCRHPPLRFVVIISGAMFKHPKWKEDCYSPSISCPSLHFIGSRDWLRNKNRELLEAFEAPVVIHHEGRHCVPRLDEEATSAVFNFLHRILEVEDGASPTLDKVFQCEESPSEIEVIA